MKRTLSVILLLILIPLSYTLAQDTIDTNYYRYITYPIKDYQVKIIDCNSMQVASDSTIQVCPNGAGFRKFLYRNNLDGSAIGEYYFIPRRNENYGTVYGLSLMVDSVSDLTCSDSLIVLLFVDDSADGQIYKRCFDSVVIDIHTPGKLRWMRMPIIYNNLPDHACLGSTESVPVDNCVENIVYSKLVEVYFDQPKVWPDCQIYWRTRHNTHFYWLLGEGIPMDLYWTADMPITFDHTTQSAHACWLWGFVFPIVQPLPKWEAELGLDSAVVLRLNGAENIDFDPADCFPVDTTTSTPDTTTSRIPSVARSASTITLSPNPANDHLTIQSSLPISVVSVTDISGRLLKTTTPHSRTCTLSVATWPTGIYILRITDPSGTTIRKFSVKH